MNQNFQVGRSCSAINNLELMLVDKHCRLLHNTAATPCKSESIRARLLASADVSICESYGDKNWGVWRERSNVTARLRYVTGLLLNEGLFCCRNAESSCMWESCERPPLVAPISIILKLKPAQSHDPPGHGESWGGGIEWWAAVAMVRGHLRCQQRSQSAAPV